MEGKNSFKIIRRRQTNKYRGETRTLHCHPQWPENKRYFVIIMTRWSEEKNEQSRREYDGLSPKGVLQRVQVCVSCVSCVLRLLSLKYLKGKKKEFWFGNECCCEFRLVARTEAEFYELPDIQLCFQNKRMYQLSFCI